MMQRDKFINWADQYLRNELDKDEIRSFEDFCQQNPEYTELLDEHISFLNEWQKTEKRNSFKNALLNEGIKLDRVKKQKNTKVISLWKKLQINIAVAAAVAVVSVFSSLWLTGYFKSIKQATTDYSALRREVNTVKRNVTAQNKAIQSINKDKSGDMNSIQFGATGFMLTKDGYAVTNYHVVHGADSIHLQNTNGQAYKAQVIYTDKEKDLAILYITDENFKSLKSIPYTFKGKSSDIGEDIFTLGFPRDEAVYGQGYLSSNTGYAGDTVAYQISIPVNPGNSGGPVLDNRGNIIGIISGKQKGIDGAAFAIKTKELMETLNQIPIDSLQGKNIVLNNKNTLANLARTEQVKRLQDYVYIVKVF